MARWSRLMRNSSSSPRAPAWKRVLSLGITRKTTSAKPRGLRRPVPARQPDAPGWAPTTRSGRDRSRRACGRSRRGSSRGRTPPRETIGRLKARMPLRVGRAKRTRTVAASGVSIAATSSKNAAPVRRVDLRVPDALDREAHVVRRHAAIRPPRSAPGSRWNSYDEPVRRDRPRLRERRDGRGAGGRARRAAGTSSLDPQLLLLGDRRRVERRRVAASRWRESGAAGRRGRSRRAQETRRQEPRPIRSRRARGDFGKGASSAASEQNSIPAMATVVFDIETVGRPWDSLDDAQRTYLAEERALGRGAREAARDALALAAHRKDRRASRCSIRRAGRGRVWYEKTDGRAEETSADGLLHVRRRHRARLPRRVLEGDAPLPPLRDVQRPRFRRAVPDAPQRGARRAP